MQPARANSGPVEEADHAVTAEAPSGSAQGDGEDIGHARTLFIDHDSEGSRYKEWRQVAIESQLYSYSDWPLEGPAAVHHLLGNPLVWLQIWARQKHIGESDRVMHELRCLTDVLFYGGTFDQLNNLPAVQSMNLRQRSHPPVVWVPIHYNMH